MIIIISLHSIFFSSFHLNNGRNMKLWQFFFCFLKILFLWNFFFRCCCVLLRFTTKRQSQIIVFVSIVYVFFVAFLLRRVYARMNSPASIGCITTALTSLFCDKYSVRCLFISIGFLTYLPIRSHIDSYIYTARAGGVSEPIAK